MHPRVEFWDVTQCILVCRVCWIWCHGILFQKVRMLIFHRQQNFKCPAFDYFLL